MNDPQQTDLLSKVPSWIPAFAVPLVSYFYLDIKKQIRSKLPRSSFEEYKEARMQRDQVVDHSLQRIENNIASTNDSITRTHQRVDDLFKLLTDNGGKRDHR